MPANATRPTVLLELDFGDADLVVQEYADGMFTINISAERLLVNVEQMQHIVDAFVAIGRAKDWRGIDL